MANVCVQSSGGVRADGLRPYEILSRTAKLQLMLKRSGVFLVLALVSVFVPILHFVLVPVFLILAVGAAWKARSLRYFIPGFSVSCPKCRDEIKFKDLYLEDEFRRFCDHCHDQLKVSIEPDKGSFGDERGSLRDGG